VLLHRRTTDSHREDQIIDRPFVVFVRASDVKRQSDLPPKKWTRR